MMIYSKERISIHDYEYGISVHCPDCNGELVAKRGDLVSWHYAHKHDGGGCSSGESAWHLACKSALMKSDYWDVEVPVVAWNGYGSHEKPYEFRLDAFCKEKLIAIEFINSLTPQYEWKAKILTDYSLHNQANADLFGVSVGEFICSPGKLKLIWIFNGDKFQRKSCWYSEKQDAYHRYLKPSAYEVAKNLQQICPLNNIHYTPPVLALASSVDSPRWGLFKPLFKYDNFWIKNTTLNKIESALVEATCTL